MTKTLIYLGLIVGSTIGGLVPMLWGGDLLSLSGIGISVVGGVAGIFAGFQFGRSFE